MLNRILAVLAALIVVGAVAVTAIALFRKGARPGEGLETLREERSRPEEGKFGREGEYNLIGRLWIPLQAAESGAKATLIVSPWLEYDGDRELYEEMDTKHLQLRGEITSFFSRMTAAELATHDEDSLKAELAARINSHLVLGKISRIWFSDYQLLEE